MPTTLYLKPHQLDAATLQPLLQQATLLKDIHIPYLNPLYILNIIDHSPIYRTLVIDTNGHYHVSTRTTTWIANTYFHTQGFSHTSWTDYLKAQLPAQRVSYPYVNGDIIYLCLPQRRHRHADWLNLTACQSMDVITNTEQHCRFYYPLPHQHLVLSFAQKTATIFKQAEWAIRLSRAWYAYIIDDLKHRFNRLSLSCQPTICEKLAPLFTQKEALPATLIEQFVLQHTLSQHNTEPPHKQPDTPDTHD